MLTEEEKLFLKEKRYVLSVQKAALLFGIALCAIYLVQILLIGVVYAYAFFARISAELITGSQVFLWILIISNQIVFISVTILYSRMNGVKLRTSLRIHCNMSYLKLLFLIIITIVCIYCLGTINYAFEKIVSGFVSSVTLTVNTPLINTPTRIVTAFIVMGLLAPICEEFLFRGALLSGLSGKGKLFGVLFSSLMFAVMHGNIYQLFYQFLLGIVLALITLSSNTIIAPIIIHSLNNILALAFDIFSYNPYTSVPILVVYLIAGIIFVPLLVIVYIFICKKESEGLFKINKKTDPKKNKNEKSDNKNTEKEISDNAEIIYLQNGENIDSETFSEIQAGFTERQNGSNTVFENQDLKIDAEKDISVKDNSSESQNKKASENSDIYEDIKKEFYSLKEDGKKTKKTFKDRIKVFKEKISDILDKLYFKNYISDKQLIENYKQFIKKVSEICSEKEVQEFIQNSNDESGTENKDNEKAADGKSKIKRLFGFSFSKRKSSKKTDGHIQKLFTFKGKELCFENLAFISEDEIRHLILNDLKRFEKVTDDIGFKNFVAVLENKISNVILTTGFAIIILIINTVLSFK